LRLSPGCDAGEVRAAVQQLHLFLKEQGWDDDDLMSFDLALVEAGNNAVRYADDAGRKQPILVEAICEEKQLEFRVHDHTAGFEWPRKIELPPPDSESGRGIYLIHKLMDWVGYFRGPGENILIMRKARTAPVKRAGSGATAPSPAEQERAISELVEELSSCYECLSAIFRYTSEGGKTANLKEFAQRLCNDLLQIIGAEWFVLRLVPKGEARLVVFAASEPALELPPLIIPADGKPKNSVETEAAMNRRSVWFDFEKPLPPLGQLIKVKPGSCGLAHPIMLGEQLIGTLTLGKPFPQHPPRMAGQLVFTAGQTNVVNTLTDFLAMQIANTRFQEEQVAQRLVRHELEIANQIQRSLLPTTLPQLEGFSLAAFCRNAHEVGGDFYDVLKINEHSALLVIADVMGKGIPAAMFAAILRTLIRAAPELTQQPAALLGRVNRLLFPELSGVDMFITAQVAFVDTKARQITVAGAGHCPMAVATAAGVKTFSPGGMPLGIQPEGTFQAESVSLPEKCQVLLYTDGLTDAVNAGKEHFGLDRLMDWFVKSAASGGTAEQIKVRLAGELEKHQSHAALSDDQTFLIMAG
jgi:serine phosphatase RsbU (regulator of sigma subunit)/anti-sigma regulatory factor (Ser/Thr protein kinase)